MTYFKLLSKFSVKSCDQFLAQKQSCDAWKFKTNLTHNLASGLELLSKNFDGRKADKNKCFKEGGGTGG